jgi:hypothetical protein
MINTKMCRKCEKVKPLLGFYKNHRMKDGHLNSCKECEQARVRPPEYYEARRAYYQQEHVKLRNKLRLSTPEAKDRQREIQKKHRLSPHGRAAKREYSKKWISENPHKVRAHWLVRSALLRGDIIKPEKCSVCDCAASAGDLHGHHDNYSLPLEVRWLCRHCHSSWHAENGEAPNCLVSKVLIEERIA